MQASADWGEFWIILSSWMAYSPKVGPKKGATAKSDIARPLCLAVNISAVTPPELVTGQAPNVPVQIALVPIESYSERRR